jgi:hypothetical protein
MRDAAAAPTQISSPLAWTTARLKSLTTSQSSSPAMSAAKSAMKLTMVQKRMTP